MIMLFGVAIIAFLSGSIPWGLILTRISTSTDIRKQGSGNIGATNVRRVAGPVIGALTLLGDVLKGALPVLLAVQMIPPETVWNEVGISIVSFSAFAGHLFPVFLKFKDGGKGVATAAGCFLVISPVGCLIALLVFIMVVYCSNYISAGSMASAAVLPAAVWITTHSVLFTGTALLIAIFIGFRHTDNIRRLIRGTEPAIRQTGKQKTL